MVIIAWLYTYFFNNILSSFTARLFELFIIAFSFFVLIFRKVRVPKVYVALFLIFILMIFFSYFRDIYYKVDNIYTLELYIKTLFYLALAFLSSYSLVCIYNEIDLKLFNRLLVCSSIFILLYLVYLLYLEGWVFGTSLLNTNFGEFYQGLSRVLSTIFIILFVLRGEVNKFILIFILIFLIFILISFNSMGAFLFLVPFFLYFLLNIINLNIKFIIFTILVFASCIFVYLYMDLGDSEVYVKFLDRANSKVDSDVEYQNRTWLQNQGLYLWMNSPFNLFFGPGPSMYSCFVDYCLSYRHPHNLFVLLLVWFGLLAVYPIIFIFKSLKNSIVFLGSKSVDLNLFGFIYIYLLMLAMVGGDIEQNRSLIFFLFLVIFIYRVRLKDNG